MWRASCCRWHADRTYRLVAGIDTLIPPDELITFLFQGAPSTDGEQVVFWGEGLHCSSEGVKTFDTDFGRIGILTCFDINFPRLWQECDEREVDVVFWPSAYAGGMPLSAYAMLYHYYIVPVGAGNIVDITGSKLAGIEEVRPRQFLGTLDLDRTFVHTNFNGAKVKRLLAEQEGKVAVERTFGPEAGWLLKATRSGARVRDLCKKYGIETLREYRHRSRRQIDAARARGDRI